MEEQVNRLVQKAWGTLLPGVCHPHMNRTSANSSLQTIDRYKQLPASKRLIIGIAGIPGSGKTTLAAKITTSLNALYCRDTPALAEGTSSPLCAFIPMDGYHLTRAQLSAMPDPTTAHARRGAAFTFDGEAFLALVRALREPLTPEMRTLYAPSFDHAVKDPVADDIPVGPYARIVVLEGNYVALDEGPWREARRLMDEVWFVEVSEKAAARRLVERHVMAGIAGDEEEAMRRVDENDLVNGREVVAKRSEVDEIVKSIEDEKWTPEAQGV